MNIFLVIVLYICIDIHNTLLYSDSTRYYEVFIKLVVVLPYFPTSVTIVVILQLSVSS